MKITTQLEIDVPQDWIDFCIVYNDLFMTSYCGYWMRGVTHKEGVGWLCYEDCDRFLGKEPDYDLAVESFNFATQLPQDWHRLDKEMAIKAYFEGVKKYGVDWYNSPKTDATTYDVVVQMAMLGEVRYG